MDDLLSVLPAHLAERGRFVGGPRPAREGFVLYWMRTAARGHENPALDVALVLGAALARPVFVVQALSERYPHASDRHHTFVLEGARDAAAELRARGVGYAFHLERPGHRGPHVRALAARAAAVVTEDFPVAPLAGWTEALARAVPAPVLAVDTACVVPMRLVGRAHDRMFRYRDATASLRAARVARPWPEVAVASPPFVPDDLPFRPVDLAHADLPALVAACEIDHGVGPIAHTRGGSRAGYGRWRDFVESGRLRLYARDRNDAARGGVSRMSAYLHHGHVSPFRLAREVSALPGKGPDKYLDELLIWRELAYTFCWHEPRHASLDALPRWARATLDEHAADPRPHLLPLEALERGATGDTLWDAAQRSLLTNGELHNNVRMTWGKAVLGWTRDAAHALATLEHLNHRYALDGRDPASYGGILWCLGLFDRPFAPERPVLGRLRPRPTADHARRLDVAAFAARATRAPYARVARVVVLGEGPAAEACARALEDHGLAVTRRAEGGAAASDLVRARSPAAAGPGAAPVAPFDWVVVAASQEEAETLARRAPGLDVGALLGSGGTAVEPALGLALVREDRGDAAAAARGGRACAGRILGEECRADVAPAETGVAPRPGESLRLFE